MGVLDTLWNCTDHPYRKHAVKPKASALLALPLQDAAPLRLRVVGFVKRKGGKRREGPPSTVTSTIGTRRVARLRQLNLIGVFYFMYVLKFRFSYVILHLHIHNSISFLFIFDFNSSMKFRHGVVG